MEVPDVTTTLKSSALVLDVTMTTLESSACLSTFKTMTYYLLEIYTKIIFLDTGYIY